MAKKSAKDKGKKAKARSKTAQKPERRTSLGRTFRGEKGRRNTAILGAVIGIVILILVVTNPFSVFFQEGELGGEEVKIELYDFVTGDKVSKDTDVRTYWVEKGVVTADDFSDADIYDINNYEDLGLSKADKIDIDLDKDNRSLAWIKIEDSNYAEDWFLIGFNGNYSFDVYPLSSSAPFNVLDKTTLDPFTNKSSGDWTVYFSIPTDKCQAPVYHLPDDELKDTLGNELGSRTEFFAFCIRFNDTITGKVTATEIVGDLPIEILLTDDSVYLVVMIEFNIEIVAPISFSMTQQWVGASGDVGVEEISSVRLTIPQDDATNLAIAQTLNTRDYT